MTSTVLPLLLLLLLSVAPAAGQAADTAGSPTNLTNYQVLRVVISQSDTADLLRGFQDTPGVDFWTELHDNAPSVDIMVSPAIREQLIGQLSSSGAIYSVNIADVQSAIAAENPPMSVAVRDLQARQGHPLTWERYHRLEDHHAYLDFVAATNPDLCQTFSIGTSTEGRDLKGIKLGSGDKEIWMDGGIHAREWISPAVVSHLVRVFSENPKKYQDILKRFTIYIIPVLNPDGYEYTHESSGQRLWRKTRSVNPGSNCIGTDGNRNFDIDFGGASTSTNPCSNIYPGPRPFSEPETNAVKQFLLSRGDKMNMYLSFHSYSQLILTPYGYTAEVDPDNLAELTRVARQGAHTLRRLYGRVFRVIQTTELYPAAGTSMDWAKKVAGIKYSYTFELRDKGRYGFLLPASQITYSAKEIVAGVTKMIRASN